jgi:hypothetical protein
MGEEVFVNMKAVLQQSCFFWLLKERIVSIEREKRAEQMGAETQ